jgi:hypothetical protein
VNCWRILYDKRDIFNDIFNFIRYTQVFGFIPCRIYGNHTPISVWPYKFYDGGCTQCMENIM